MEKKILKNGEKLASLVVARIPYKVYTPYYGDYADPSIKKIIPCIVSADGNIKDLATGRTINAKGAVIWDETPGTVFEYPNGERYLVTRLVGKHRSIAVLPEGESWSFSPVTMTIRKVRL